MVGAEVALCCVALHLAPRIRMFLGGTVRGGHGPWATLMMQHADAAVGWAIKNPGVGRLSALARRWLVLSAEGDPGVLAADALYRPKTDR